MSLPPNVAPEEMPVYKLWKRCLEMAGPYRAEGQGLRVKVELGIDSAASIESEITPQPVISRGYSRPRQKPKPVIRAQVEDALKGQEDLVTLEETDGIFAVKPKRYLGDDWGGVNDVLRPLGFRWHRENKRWEAPKKK